jgi:hypothetical protein
VVRALSAANSRMRKCRNRASRFESWSPPLRLRSGSKGQLKELRRPGAAARANGGRVHRYYDPATGQFLSVDPLVDETGKSYAYTGDDPENEADSSGLSGAPPEATIEYEDTHVCGYDGVKCGSLGSAADDVTSAFASASNDVTNALASATEWVNKNKDAIGLIVAGAVVVVGATIVTGGLIDLTVLTVEGAETVAISESAEGSATGLLELVDVAVHAPLVLAPGFVVGGMGLGLVGWGINSLVSANGTGTGC